MRRLDLLLVLVFLTSCATGGMQRGAVAPSNTLSDAGRTNLGLAAGYLQANLLKKAADRAGLALASDPGSAQVHAMLAMIHDRNGEFDRAAGEFDIALKIAPSEGAILNAHASWLCDRGQTTQADIEFSRALDDADYQSPLQALSNAGNCAHKAMQWPKAEGYLRRALEISPDARPLLLLLADTELQQGKVFEAQAFIQRSDSLGSDAATLELAARIEDAAGDKLAAARYRQRLQDEFPDFVVAPQGSGKP